jgi:probable rRNA maturation factor
MINRGNDKRITKIFGLSLDKIVKAVVASIQKNKTISEIGLVFVSKKRMLELNKKYRGKNKVTNVLSFSEGPPNDLGAGDIVICPVVVKREAQEYGFTQKYWMTRLVVHGILHLIGYGHVRVRDRKEMEGLEKNILGRLGV